jgi:type I restriction enzyme M protein
MRAVSTNARQIVQKLWSYCSILRDDGLSYPDYVEQLTYLLFLKMAHEATLSEPDRPSAVPVGLDWPSLVEKSRRHLHAHYGRILETLGSGQGMLGIIFRNAENKIRDPAKLRLLVVDLIDQRNWSALDIDVKGDAYEGLLERNAQDTKSGAGQYFTPRPLVDAIVECVMPQLGEVIYDPACGTGGFLIAAHRYISERNRRLSPAKARHLRLEAIRGAELVSEVTRLAAMNLLLHGIGPLDGEEEPPIVTQDSLAVPPSRTYDLILTNPPFGKRSSVTVVTKRRDLDEDSLNVVRDDLWASTSNKELNFLQHVASILSSNGRAAIVVPDGVLTAGGPGEVIRRRLLQDFDVHTLLRLPTGIFYAAGVNANVLFLDRKSRPAQKSERRLWVYDFRTNMHFTLVGKRLERSDLDEFVVCYNAGKREGREATWSTENQSGRWRSFTYDELMQRDRANLDLSWIADEGRQLYRSPRALEELTDQIADDLREALTQISELTAPR